MIRQIQSLKFIAVTQKYLFLYPYHRYLINLLILGSRFSSEEMANYIKFTEVNFKINKHFNNMYSVKC